MPKYADEKEAEPVKAPAKSVEPVKQSRKLDTSGSATNTIWSTKGGAQSINKSVSPAADKQSRSR